MNAFLALRRLIILILVFSGALLLDAQQDTGSPPNYRIFAEDSRISEDGTEIIIAYTVYNSGGASSVEATVRLTDTDPVQAVASATIRPLRANGDTEQGEIRIPVTTFPNNSRQLLRLEVGIGEVEASSGDTTFDNGVFVDVNVPDYLANQPAQPPPTATVDQVDSRGDEGIITIPGTDIEIDTRDPRDLAIIAGIILASLLILLILWTMLRLIFRRAPTFTNWQPPYAFMSHIDPNSPAGQRQQWQQFAQNSLLPTPCQEGVVQARKVLLGMDGFYLSGWRLKALRMTQYDMYGRVAKSQVNATMGQLNRLNGIIRRLSTLSPEQTDKKVRPVSRVLANQFRKRITKRSALLPIALDLLVQGTHGEVRILFELHQCQHGRYQQLDNWEPEMTVSGKAIQEIYTFTIFGQSGGETYREFRRRLNEDINQAFVDLLHNGQLTEQMATGTGTFPPTPAATQTATQNASAPATTPNIPPVAVDTSASEEEADTPPE